MPLPVDREHLTVDREHTLRGKKTLEWFFANRMWIRGARLTVIECGWTQRPQPADSLPGDEAAVRFLLLASKRSYKRAHDRNQIKRWLRAAIAEAPEFARLEAAASERGVEIFVMMRISKPIRQVRWLDIVSDAHSIASLLLKRSIMETVA